MDDSSKRAVIDGAEVIQNHVARLREYLAAHDVLDATMDGHLDVMTDQASDTILIVRDGAQ